MVARVVSMIASVEGKLSDAQVAGAIVGDVLMAGERVDGHTIHGTTAQRYEAACALSRPVSEYGRRSDLIDTCSTARRASW